MNEINNDFSYWQNYRKQLTNNLKEPKEKVKKTPENIIAMAKEIGIKPTARYFNIDPKQVRIYIKKSQY